MPPPKIIAIAAMNENRVIGAQGKIPWHIPEDMKRFAQLTTGYTVLMGRKTYESLPDAYRPLPDRHNIVVTRRADSLKGQEGIRVVDSARAFIMRCMTNVERLETTKLWIIGGGEIYGETMPLWEEVYLTLVKGKQAGDVYFPEFEEDFDLLSEEKHETHSYLHYTRKS